MVLADSRRIPRAPRYSGATLSQVAVSPTGLSPAAVTFSNVFGYTFLSRCRWSYNPDRALTRTVWALARSLAATGAIIGLFSFPAGTEMFQFPAFAPDLQAW